MILLTLSALTKVSSEQPVMEKNFRISQDLLIIYLFTQTLYLKILLGGKNEMYFIDSVLIIYLCHTHFTFNPGEPYSVKSKRIE